MIASATRQRLLVIVSAVIAGGAVAMLPAIIAGLIYREWADTLALVAAAAIGVIVGLIGRRYGGGQGSFTSSEASARKTPS